MWEMFYFSQCIPVHESIHIGEKPYICNRCEKLFSSSIYLEIHEETHTEKEPYVDKVRRHFCDSHNPKKIQKLTMRVSVNTECEKS